MEKCGECALMNDINDKLSMLLEVLTPQPDQMSVQELFKKNGGDLDGIARDLKKRKSLS